MLSSPQFERLWRAHVKRRFGWLQVLAQTAFIWVIATLLVLALFIIRRRRDRRKLDLLRATELPDSPAYWLENGDAEGEVPPGESDASPDPHRERPREEGGESPPREPPA